MKAIEFPDNRFTRHVVAFGRVLRRAGLDCATPQIMDALRALRLIGIRNRQDVYQALFSVFVTRREHVELFNQAFTLFWRAPSRLPDIMKLILPQLNTPTSTKSQTSLRVRQALIEPELQKKPEQKQPENDEREAVDLVLTYSPTEILRKKDFADFSAEEVLEARRLIAEMHWPISPRKTRRLVPKSGGSRIDFRKTIRGSLRSHGEVVRLRHVGRATRPRNLVVLCDISGSMERYSRLLLHFLHVLTNGLLNVETFVFGTRLTRITRYLSRSDIDEAIDRVSAEVIDWAGGTRIGDALREFNYVWARRVLRSSGVALIISDGWDRGDIPLLEREIARLARSSTRLIWLNPLLGYKDYEPLTRGIQAVLPNITDFLPVHNLESLTQIGLLLASLRKGEFQIGLGEKVRAKAS